MGAWASPRRLNATNSCPPQLPLHKFGRNAFSCGQCVSEYFFKLTFPDNCCPSRAATLGEYNGLGRPLHVCIVEARFSTRELMYHYDASIALEELKEDALLPHPVRLRDMILRTQLGPEEAKTLNHEFQDYLTRFGELQNVARGVLEKIAAGRRKAS